MLFNELVVEDFTLSDRLVAREHLHLIVEHACEVGQQI